MLRAGALLLLSPRVHIYGMVPILHSSLYVGATLVVLPQFEPEVFLSTLAKFRVNKAHLVPPIILFLAKARPLVLRLSALACTRGSLAGLLSTPPHPTPHAPSPTAPFPLANVQSPLVQQHDVSALEMVMSGAAPLDAATQVSVASAIGCDVAQGYGMTESSPVTHVTPLGAPEDAAAGMAGKLVPGTEGKIVGDDGAELPAGEVGELWVRGPQVCERAHGTHTRAHGVHAQGTRARTRHACIHPACSHNRRVA